MCCRFVKFSTIEAARRALDMYNGTVIDGVEYVMKSGYSKQRDVAVSSRERNSDSRSSGQDSSELLGLSCSSERT